MHICSNEACSHTHKDKRKMKAGKGVKENSPCIGCGISGMSHGHIHPSLLCDLQFVVKFSDRKKEAERIVLTCIICIQ